MVPVNSLFLSSLLLSLVAGRVLPRDEPKDQSNDQSNDESKISYYSLEEHWLAPSLVQYFAKNEFNILWGADASISQLQEIGAERIASMDANNIAMQVLSGAMVPEVLSSPDLAATANRELAEAIAKSPAPSRFRGFCQLAMDYPSSAAEELMDCVQNYKMVGALIEAHLANGTFYDGAEYDAVWEVATKLDVPIYLHPTYTRIEEVTQYREGLYAPMEQGEYTLNEAAILSMTGWGWHEEVTLGFLRMYLAGVFERYPNLKIVLGHMGEMLPYFLSRADMFLSPGRSVSLVEVYARNVYITTSGVFSVDPMATMLRNTDISRIMYSVDWPMEKNEDGMRFMEALRESGMVTCEEFEQIAYKNAVEILKLECVEEDDSAKDMDSNKGEDSCKDNDAEKNADCGKDTDSGNNTDADNNTDSDNNTESNNGNDNSNDDSCKNEDSNNTEDCKNANSSESSQ